MRKQIEDMRKEKLGATTQLENLKNINNTLEIKKRELEISNNEALRSRIFYNYI